MLAPRISVALVTRNRPASLARTLRSLRSQTMQPFEVVVSDDSDAGSADEARAVALEYDCRYQRGPQRGLYANRNACARACTGTHVRTMDDDHEFPLGHWQECEAAVVRDPVCVWIIGEMGPTQTLRDANKSPGELHPRGFSQPPRDPNHTWAIADGASIYPAGIFAAGVAYSEAFKFGSSYLEFGSRLHWLGYRIRHLPDTYVIHHFDAGTRSFSDAQEELAAKAFATLSHSFAYQPTLRNKFLTTAELARQVAATRGNGVRAVWRGYTAFRQGREALTRASSARTASMTADTSARRGST
jgi:glycosyltransferase involved in cell wall biosynthesis